MSPNCDTCQHVDLDVSKQPCRGCSNGSGWTPFPAAASEGLRADQRRLEWLLPVIGTAGDTDRVGNARTMALGAALMLGKTDRDAIDFAMEGSP